MRTKLDTYAGFALLIGEQGTLAEFDELLKKVGIGRGAVETAFYRSRLDVGYIKEPDKTPQRYAANEIKALQADIDVIRTIAKSRGSEFVRAMNLALDLRG